MMRTRYRLAPSFVRSFNDKNGPPVDIHETYLAQIINLLAYKNIAIRLVSIVFIRFYLVLRELNIK